MTVRQPLHILNNWTPQISRRHSYYCGKTLFDFFYFVLNIHHHRCDKLTCSGWVRSPYCSTRCPTQGSGRVLDSGPLETVSPRHCSGTQPGCGRIPVDWRKGRERGESLRWPIIIICWPMILYDASLHQWPQSCSWASCVGLFFSLSQFSSLIRGLKTHIPCVLETQRVRRK